MLNNADLLSTQDLSKRYFDGLESRWLALPREKREQIEKVVEHFQSRGAAVSAYEIAGIS